MIKLSILILSIPSRRQMREKLVARLQPQIVAYALPPQAEVLVFEDDRQLSVGAKRNRLMNQAAGEFMAFVDDDDDVSDDYVSKILKAIQENPGVDCVGMRGIITVNGGAPRQVSYSIRHKDAIESEGVYLRPPGHLNPIRTALARRYPFREVSVGEDVDFTARVAKDRALKSEVFVDRVLYHYIYSSAGTETQKGGVPSGVMGLDHTIWNVVILSARPENLRGCVKSILDNEPIPQSRIAVVDDGAGEACRKEFPGLTWLKGQKPFIFARNANIGINSVFGDVILMNDDARLVTKYGFSSMSFAARDRKDVGLMSAYIYERGGPYAGHAALGGVKSFQGNFAFVCVYIPRSTVARIGHLDERFIGYGFEDNDYCRRVDRAALLLGTYEACVVRHGSPTESTFRSRHDFQTLYAMNDAIYKEKWKGQP